MRRSALASLRVLFLLRFIVLGLASAFAWLVRCPQQFPWELVLLGGWLLWAGSGYVLARTHPQELAQWQRRLAGGDLLWATVLNVVSVWQHGVPLHFPLYVLGVMTGAYCWGRKGALAVGAGGVLTLGIIGTIAEGKLLTSTWLAAVALVLAWTLLVTVGIGLWRPQPTVRTAPRVRASASLGGIPEVPRQ